MVLITTAWCFGISFHLLGDIRVAASGSGSAPVVCICAVVSCLFGLRPIKSITLGLSLMINCYVNVHADSAVAVKASINKQPTTSKSRDPIFSKSFFFLLRHLFSLLFHFLLWFLSSTCLLQVFFMTSLKNHGGKAVEILTLKHWIFC